MAKHFLSALVLASPAAFANTYLVDDQPGPGVDFTEISAAVAAAAPGDVIRVRAGTYAGFSLSAGISVVGLEPDVRVAGSILVTGLPPGPRASLVRLTATQVEITNCSAPVLVTDFVVEAPASIPLDYTANVEVRESSDVRLRAVRAVPDSVFEHGCSALFVEASRVEVVQSTLTGRAGVYGDGTNGTPGHPGILAWTGADVHVSSSMIQGGTGGGATNYGNPWFGGYGGAGAAGIQLWTGASVLLTGTAAHEVRGGQGGYSDDCAHDGTPAPGISNAAGNPASSMRHSGVVVRGAATYIDCGGFEYPAFGGPHELAAPVDTSLVAQGPLTPGSQVTYVVRGAPGDAARLRLGRQLTIVDLPDVVEDRLLLPLRTFDLGTLPASGEATFTFPLSSALPSGFVVVAQASCTEPGGATRLSQSIPIVLP